MSNNYICAVDIGSNKISASVACLKKNEISGLFFETIASRGLKKGSVTDSIELISCIGKVLKSLKAKSGINIKLVYLNISGEDITTKHSHAIIPLAERGNKVITLSDIQKCNEQARILGSSLEDEIIQQIPYSYSIDSKAGILQPLGLYSHRLEVDLYLVCAKLSSVQNLTRVINQAGFEMRNMYFSGLATSKALFDKNIPNGVNVVCDIGSDITEILIFKDGVIKSIEILPQGGNDLVSEISSALKIPFELAEDVKRSHSIIGDYTQIQEDKEILIKKDNLYRPIKQKLVAEILTAKANSICQNIKENIEKKIRCTEISNFYTVGRTILTDGFLETLESVAGIPVKIGRIGNSTILPWVNKEEGLAGQKYLTYITSLGMICEALEEERFGFSFSKLPTRNIFKNAIIRAKEVYQEYF